jgi:hypothetical protein
MVTARVRNNTYIKSPVLLPITSSIKYWIIQGKGSVEIVVKRVKKADNISHGQNGFTKVFKRRIKLLGIVK